MAILYTPALIILSLRPNADFTMNLDYDSLVWLDKVQVKPTEKEYNDAVTAWQANYDAQEYARNREAEYPSIAELTVALYDTDDKAAIDAKRAAVKAKYPKPS